MVMAIILMMMITMFRTYGEDKDDDYVCDEDDDYNDIIAAL